MYGKSLVYRNASLTARLCFDSDHFRPSNPTILGREIVFATRVISHGHLTCWSRRRIFQRNPANEPSTAPRGLRQQLCVIAFRIDSLTALGIKAKTHNARRGRNMHRRNTIRPYLYHTPIDCGLETPGLCANRLKRVAPVVQGSDSRDGHPPRQRRDASRR